MADCFTCDSIKVVDICVLPVFFIIALVSVLFRLWARKTQKIMLELNDYLCIVGLVFTLAMGIFTIHAKVNWALGPVPDFRIIVLQYKAMIVGQILWVTSVTLIRASVLFLYIRIFRTLSFRMTCYVVHAVNVAFFIAVVLACSLICRPFAYQWDHSIKGTCGKQKSLDLFIGIFNLILDVTTVALPMPVLWTLQLPTNKKVALTGMFSMGTAICVTTLVRIKVTNDINPQSAQHQYATIALLANLEALLGVTNACLPVMKPIFNKLGEKRVFESLVIWTSKLTSGKRKLNPRSNHGYGPSSSDGNFALYHNKPKRVMRKDSHLTFPQSPTKSEEYTGSSPVKSKYRLPETLWEKELQDVGNGNSTYAREDWDVEQHSWDSILPVDLLPQRN